MKTLVSIFLATFLIGCSPCNKAIRQYNKAEVKYKKKEAVALHLDCIKLRVNTPDTLVKFDTIITTDTAYEFFEEIVIHDTILLNDTTSVILREIVKSGAKLNIDKQGNTLAISCTCDSLMNVIINQQKQISNEKIVSKTETKVIEQKAETKGLWEQIKDIIVLLIILGVIIVTIVIFKTFSK